MNTIPESHRHLIEAPHVASLSTVSADGAPHVSAVWYVGDGDMVAISLTTDRQKYKNIVANPKVSLFIIDPENPFRTLEIRAAAAIEDDAGLVLFDRIVRRYGQDPERFPAPKKNRVAVRLRSTRVVAQG